ncbi:hypothetical protein EMIHUDRAFT_460201 [Emiliania huxleyi CCMP1516]|uniref:MBD domain-containing protein n=2 Tax=Emiliania huxleyi TaxID=2903 RepID=A0A0D3I1E1_EMIH1|nr:hypothetical protein EMIHUDRAFT_460201 [Emiliania huxleyi CCMP1516]EOD05076.1 hypothetical protein EMIHUDRAFT_460201 [Emiliania huxleyi CCMP1516]|eukprot:XP_005757505.1 hypothetical protein EMIHUDRAFT_460201 [Emiliania huxleyi CCMP1516]
MSASLIASPSAASVPGGGGAGAALVPGAVHSALLAPSELPSAAPVPRARVIIPADVRIPVPAEAVAGGRVSFHYEQLIYTAALPRLAASGSCLLRLTVAHWREASAAAARRRREEAARQRAQAQAQRKEARVQREVRAAVESLVSAVEGDEREVRGVVQGLVLSLEAEERRRRAAERQEAQRAREVGVVLVREVEAGGDAVEREVARTLDRVVGRVLRLCDPRYAGLDSPEYAHAQLVALYKKKCLVGGWSIRVDVRQTGGSAGETDLYFFDERGKKFRSRLEVARHFGLAAEKRKRRGSAEGDVFPFPAGVQGGGGEALVRRKKKKRRCGECAACAAPNCGAERWLCHMNPDATHAACGVPEQAWGGGRAVRTPMPIRASEANGQARRQPRKRRRPQVSPRLVAAPPPQLPSRVVVPQTLARRPRKQRPRPATRPPTPRPAAKVARAAQAATAAAVPTPRAPLASTATSGANRVAGAGGFVAEDHPAAGCDEAVAAQAASLLRRRFPSCVELIGKLLDCRQPLPQIQCHAAGRVLPAPPHRLLVVREGGRVVAAALLLHVAPRRRQSDDTRFSQTTLFAVDESEERRRIGRLRHSLVAYSKLCCARAQSRRLLIMSSGNRFWRNPRFGLGDISAADPMVGRRFDPWTQPCAYLGFDLGGAAGSSTDADAYLRPCRRSLSEVRVRTAKRA